MLLYFFHADVSPGFSFQHWGFFLFVLLQMDLRLLLIATLSVVLGGSWAQQGKNKCHTYS